MKTITISKRTYMQAAIGNAQRQRQALYTMLLKVLPVVLLALVSANGLIAQNMDMQATFSSFRGNCPEVGDEEYTWRGGIHLDPIDPEDFDYEVRYNCQTVDADNSPYVMNYDREGLVRNNTSYPNFYTSVSMFEDDYLSRCDYDSPEDDCLFADTDRYYDEFPNINEFSETTDTYEQGNSEISLTTSVNYRYTRFPLSQVLQPSGSNGDLANPIGTGPRPFWGSQGSWANGVSGSYTAASGTIEHNGQSRLKITPINKSSVSFLWKADTELNFDKVTVYVNFIPMKTLSGQTGWEAVTIDMPAGTSVNTVSWEYTKDGSVSTGEDRVWIKNLVLNDGIPDIDVLGNGISIASGDITPSFEDDTDFGEVPLGSFADKTYTVRNAGTDDLRVNLEAISSTNPEFELIDFSVSGLYSMPPGTTETFTMRFTPTTTGIKTTDIEIPNITPNPNESLWYEIRLQGGDEMCPAVINTCPLAITVAADPGSCSASGVALGNPATDACPGETITNDAPATFPIGNTTVTWTVTAVNGGTATCTAVITVEDNEDPVIACAPNGTRTTDPTLCEYTVIGTEFDATFTDNCTASVITNDLNGTATIAGEVLVKGDTTVIWTVDDGNGQTASCTTVITVEDNENPVITCAANGTRDTDLSVCEYTVVGTEFDATFTDNCTDGNITNDLNGTTTIAGEVLPIGDTTVIWTVDDGNGQIVTCTTVITVEDNEDPIIACSTDVIANTDAGQCGTVVVFSDALAIDNCGIDTVIQTGGLPSGSPFPVGINTVQFTATDSSGNTSVCEFTITITDNEPATAVCQDITIQLDVNGDATIVAADVDGGSTDNCGIASLAVDMNTFDCSNVGPNNVTLEVTDVNGNSSTCIAVVTVEDVTMPDVVCMDITVQLDATGTITILGSDVDGGSTDACGIVSYDLDMDTFDCSNVGENTVTLTVTDTNGNVSTCSAVVTVEDVTAPELVCMDITVELDVNGMVMITPEDLMQTNDDACGILTTAVDIFEFDCSDIGTPIEVQVFSSDANGNLSTCFATVTVVDALAPEVTCPADQTVDPGPGTLFYTVPDYFGNGDATAIDNCTDPLTILSQDPVAGTLLPDGTYTITMTAEDESGNIGSCSFELTVESLLGLDEVTVDLSSIVMYPNPANAVVHIRNPQGLELAEAAIYDITGRLVARHNLRDTAMDTSLDISELSSATYLVLISGPEGQITKQLIKE